uniref:nuclear factor related to kappa-B-binding protein-like isoform X2 n=1 Tax=Ostrea edulis TaxID=37623 RepID=UPI0020943F5B|nr:nuclear factor related to kappa-B-binding protein-like isoform X2 [Ostrea edulis]XP_056012397.1 nuclear factor related to kappa-B-binding protein-like isoform X2 [Ostrea edulis]
MSSSEESEDDNWGLPTPSSGPKMERCLLGKTEFLLPESMLEQSHVFRDVLSMDTWKNVLTEEQRTHLNALLPTFPSNDTTEKEECLQKLFGNENFKFGNPLSQLQTKMRDGFCSPDIAKYSSLCRNIKYREYQHRQQRYYSNLLKDILLSRQKAYENIQKVPPGGRLEFTHNPSANTKRSSVEHRSKKKYVRLMKEVRQECGMEDTSSEEEDTTVSAQRMKKQLFKSVYPLPSPDPTIPSVVHTFSSKPLLVNGDITVSSDGQQVKRPRPFSPVEVTEEDYRNLLRNHKRKKLSTEEDHPDLNTDSITLQDVMSRCQATNRTSPNESMSPDSNVSASRKKTLKLKDKTEKKLKKVLKIKKEGLDYSAQPLMYSEEESLSPINLDIKEEPLPDLFQQDNALPKIPASFGLFTNYFSLLRDVVIEFDDGKATTAKLEEKVREWQESSSAPKNVWFSLVPNWVDCVLQALKFLAGDLIDVSPPNFVPYVDYKERAQQWRWIGAGRDSDDNMTALFKHFITSRKDGNCDLYDGGAGSTPPPRSKTGYVVKATTDEEKVQFREQEARRFMTPHKAFTYRMHDYESVVGPVKGVYTKDNSNNKAREHALLVSNRPSFVTILTLVRDSAARLPNGEGTRGDICELLKDSQFLAPGVSDAQINVVVSGALDRLHSEKDPCVKYDVNRKLWIYLHRNRSEEEFEKIHQAHGAAQKAKKSLQKPKTQKSGKVKDTSVSLSTSVSSPSLKSALSSDTLGIDDSMSVTPASPSVAQSPRSSNSPLVGQVSPRGLSNSSPRSTANQATIAALKNAVSAGTVPGSQGNILHSQSAATIRLHLQQQQQQLQQKASSVSSTPHKSTAKPESPTVTIGSTRSDTPQGLPQSVPLGLLQSLRTASPNVTQSITSALRQELLAQRQNSGSPAPSPVISSTAINKVTEKVTMAATPTSTMATTPSAQLVTRLVQQVSGNQMVNVSNLLAAQRVQGPRGNVPTTLKIQGGNLLQPVGGGKPLHLAGKPLTQARGQLVQITGKGAQQLIQTPQGALPISIIPQGGGAAGVMTLGQPRTPPVPSDSGATSSPNIQTITRTSQGNPAIITSQSKVVTPSQGGIVVTQLPPGLTIRPGSIPVSSHCKMVSGGQAGGQAGLLSQIIMQSSGVLTGTSSSHAQSIAGGVPLLVSGAGGKPGQNIQVVRTVLGQQANLKPGQATILISQPTLQSNANVIHTGQLIQSSAKSKAGPGKTPPVYARIITPPPGQKSAPGTNSPQPPGAVSVLQTVNKFISVANASATTVSPASSPVTKATTDTTQTITLEMPSDGNS